MNKNVMNIGYFYNKKYFEGINFDFLTKEDEKAPKPVLDKINQNNKKLEEVRLPGVIENASCQDKAYRSFTAKVAYPGLITGIGLNHEVSIEGEFKLGVHFDYTTGIPNIYGSSVKGVLKSYFDDYCQELFPDLYKVEIKNSIFDGLTYDGKESLSIYARDIFFDAVIVKAGKNNQILCADSITPHNENPLKNPTPITFLKVAPGCEIEFRFLLRDTMRGDEVIFSAECKKVLFEKIIREVGVGAKTNVGYGQFLEHNQSFIGSDGGVVKTKHKIENKKKLEKVNAVYNKAIRKVCIQYEGIDPNKSFELVIENGKKLGRKDVNILVDVFFESGKIKKVVLV